MVRRKGENNINPLLFAIKNYSREKEKDFFMWSSQKEDLLWILW